jgi:hypothetical protein
VVRDDTTAAPKAVLPAVRESHPHAIARHFDMQMVDVVVLYPHCGPAPPPGHQEVRRAAHCCSVAVVLLTRHPVDAFKHMLHVEQEHGVAEGSLGCDQLSLIWAARKTQCGGDSGTSNQAKCARKHSHIV